MLDYLKWRGDISFLSDGFGPVDGLILSTISYADFSSSVSGYHSGKPAAFPDAAFVFEKYSNKSDSMGALVPKKTPELIRLAAKTKRFSEAKVLAFVNEVDEAEGEQFCAISFLLPDDSIFIAYRGTDDSIVGWREDFCLSYSSPVRAQTRAVEFLEGAAAARGGKIRLGGHSKGGNLAFFASVFCSPETKDRIVRAYSYDGPGFGRSVSHLDEYKNISDRLESIIPESSFVGLLLEHPENYLTVSSDAISFFQHDPFTWKILGKDFVYESAPSRGALKGEAAIKSWLDSISEADRRRFVDIFFGIIEKTGAGTLTELTESKLRSAASIVKAIGETSDDEKKYMTELFSLFIERAVIGKTDAKTKTKLFDRQNRR